MQKTAITETGRHGAIYAKQARKRCSRAQAAVEAHDLVGSDLVSKRTRPGSSGLADPTGDDCSGLDLALITELEPFERTCGDMARCGYSLLRLFNGHPRCEVLHVSVMYAG